MKPRRFVAKSALVEAIQYDASNEREIMNFAGARSYKAYFEHESLEIDFGDFYLNLMVGDLLVKNEEGDLFVMPEEIFEQTYVLASKLGKRELSQNEWRLLEDLDCDNQSCAN